MEASTPEKSQKKTIVKQALGVVLALVFLWLAFRGTDPVRLWSYIKEMQPLYLIPLAASCLFSHFLRAWRWCFLLAPLSENKISLWNSFCAVMVGYAVNIVLPRGGEVARLISISRSERLSWAGVLPTMFIDRMLDIACLVAVVGICLAVFPARLFGGVTWLGSCGVSLAVLTFFGLLALPFVGGGIRRLISLSFIEAHLSAKIFQSLEKLAGDFELGTRSLANAKLYPAIVLLTLGIWFFYWLNLYLMIMAFGLDRQVSYLQSLIVFAIGSMGVLIPTPGSVGSYHLLISRGLMMVSNVNQDQALAFASVLHAFLFVIIIALGAALCLIIQSARNKGSRGLQAEAGLSGGPHD